MIDISEKNFETTIETQLLNIGYRKGNAKNYDRQLCLIPEDILNFIKTTQLKEWEKFQTLYQEEAPQKLLKRIAELIKTRGTLEVLRKGIKANGCSFKLAYFRPATRLNEETQKLYQANFFTILRQLHYSEKNRKSLDIVLFLNGLPLFTGELKNPLSGQTVEDGIKQYREDRDPKEPLFKLGVCLSHFAVDPNLVYMTTELLAHKTRFLPFNQGKDNGAGNPPSALNFSTAYLWEKIWHPDSILNLIQNFIILYEDDDDEGKKTGKKRLIFPRYHQLDTVARLLLDAKTHGSGQRYLIQHSAGSGKSNSIAWLSHQLVNLHNSQDERVFDSIIVITDRRILDRQLQQTLRQFEQMPGIVENIDKTSSQLKDALSNGKQIIVTTLQKFSFILDQIQTLAGKTFAIIIDEAHSSQSGESSKNLKAVLAAKTLEEATEADTTEEETLEDRITEAARLRGPLANISYFAFTATPKAKTLELFGSKQPDGSYKPFSLYSMRQAIEEGFILDVLQNYTNYTTYFKLLKIVEQDPHFDRQKASILLRNFVELHYHTINQKLAIMVEQFHEVASHQIEGQAKAMIVTRSRLHAVRYKLALDAYLKQQGYPYKSLVAFTGTVIDGGISYTESGLNTRSNGLHIPETATATTFNQPDYRFLIVANKFQTGFNQPLLNTMYIDKKIGGINAVQTLSRLNRTYANKNTTFVLDFANEASEIQAAFEAYYDRTMLVEESDPNLLYDLQTQLDDYGFYQPTDIDKFAQIFFSPKGTQDKLYNILAPIVSSYNQATEAEQMNFRSQLQQFIRLYGFISQLLRIPDVDLEKFYQFARYLGRILPVLRQKLSLKLKENIALDSYRLEETHRGNISLDRGMKQLNPIQASAPKTPQEEELEALSQIVLDLNQRFGTNFNDDEKLFISQLENKLDSNPALKASVRVNSQENIRLSFEKVTEDMLQEMIESNFGFYKRFNDDQDFAKNLLNALFTRFMERFDQKKTP